MEQRYLCPVNKISHIFDVGASLLINVLNEVESATYIKHSICLLHHLESAQISVVTISNRSYNSNSTLIEETGITNLNACLTAGLMVSSVSHGKLMSFSLFLIGLGSFVWHN